MEQKLSTQGRTKHIVDKAMPIQNAPLDNGAATAGASQFADVAAKQ